MPETITITFDIVKSLWFIGLTSFHIMMFISTGLFQFIRLKSSYDRNNAAEVIFSLFVMSFFWPITLLSYFLDWLDS